MTEEELVDEYVSKNGFESDCNNITSQEANEAIRQAYLAGYNNAPVPMA